MSRLYERLVRARPSVNMTNRLHMALENWLTPDKCLRMLKSLLGSATADGEQSRTWAKKLRAMMDTAGKLAAEPFRRRCIAAHVSLYEGPAPEGKSAKALLFCFTGAAQRPMMPLPVFLQNLDAAQVDVVVVRYPKRRSFRNGIPGIGDTFEEAIEALPTLVDTGAYARVFAIGTSGGAVPALLFALAQGCEAVLAVGAGSPQDDRWPAGAEPPQSLARRFAAASAGTRCMLMFGEDEPDDVRAAHEWKAILPDAHLLPVRLPDEKVGHVALFAYVVTSRLTGFMHVFLKQRRTAAAGGR